MLMLIEFFTRSRPIGDTSNCNSPVPVQHSAAHGHVTVPCPVLPFPSKVTSWEKPNLITLSPILCPLHLLSFSTPHPSVPSSQSAFISMSLEGIQKGKLRECKNSLFCSWLWSRHTEECIAGMEHQVSSWMG